MILLDTTVLVYAVGEEHRLRPPARDVLAALGEGHLEATTTVEVLQEFMLVRARRTSRPDAAALVAACCAALEPVVTTADDLRRGARLFEQRPGLGAFDSVLAAVAMRLEADALVSADRAFGAVDGLRWMDLADPDLIARLRG